MPFAKTGDDRPSVVTVLYINLYTHKHFTCDLAGSERNQTQQSRANGVESFLLDSTTGIMNPMSTEALVWKLQGNTHCRDGKYLKAIEW